MEILILVLLIVIAILFQEHKTLSGAFIFLAGIMSLAFGLTTNTITSIIGETINYATVDPLITWVIGLALISISIIHWLGLIQ
jgi:hypothetical protein